MFKAGVELFFGKFAIYIIAFFIALSVVLGVGWYVSNVQLERQTGKANGLRSQLEMTNASFSSVKQQYVALTKTLEDNQEKVLANQAVMKDGLTKALEQGKDRQKLEQTLLTRKPETDCVTPKDLIDAWSRL